MNEFHKEKAKTNVELLKIVASGTTLFFLLLGNLLMKDNFGERDQHYLYFVFLLTLILIGAILCYLLYVSIEAHLNKSKND